MSSVAFRLGKVWGSIGQGGQLAVVLAAIAAVTIPSYISGKAELKARTEAAAAAEAASAAASAAESARLVAEAQVRQQALTAKCVTNIRTLASTAAAVLKAGKPVEAASHLIPCEGTMTDPQAISLLGAARKASEAATQRARATMVAAERKKKRSEGVAIGMTMQDVIDSSWGRPTSVNKTTTIHGTREQWVYDGGYLYFDNGVLTAVQN